MEILSLASRAPSGHNTQPWTVTMLSQNHWTIGIEKSRLLSAVDPAARETLLSLGAFLENLAIAALNYGFRVEYSVPGGSFLTSAVIDLRFLPAKRLPQRLDSLQLRRTVRAGHQERELGSADLRALMKYGDGLYYFPKGSASAKFLSVGTVEANRQQASSQLAEEELSRWIRWSAADAEKYRDGLTPASMEIKGLAGWYTSHFFNRASVLTKSFRETTVKQVRERVSQGGGWLVVTSKSDAALTLIETGRKVERMWLGLRDKDIAVHPMTQMLEEAPFSKQVAPHLGIEGTPQFLLRVGYLSSYPMPASVRMPPSWIIRGVKA